MRARSRLVADTDGRPVVDPVSEEQAGHLQSLMDQLKPDTKARVVAYIQEQGFKSAAQLPSSQYDRWVRSLTKKLGEQEL